MNININNTKKRIAYDILWDTDGDDEMFYNLPDEIEIPDDITDMEEISDYISDDTGFCHFGFKVKEA